MNAYALRTSLLVVIVLCLSGSFSGCASSQPLETIEGEDSGVFFPAVRLTYQVSPQKPWNQEGDTPPVPIVGTLSIDVDFAFGTGDSTQNISAGERVLLDSVVFTGPASIKADYDLNVGSVAARGGMLIHGAVAVEGIAGLGFHHLDIEIESAGTKDDDDVFSVGPIVGGRITYGPFRWLDIYGQGTVTFGIGDDVESDFTAIEVGAVVHPHPHVAVMGGWRWWKYDAERDISFTGFDTSDIDLELSGPTVALIISF